MAYLTVHAPHVRPNSGSFQEETLQHHNQYVGYAVVVGLHPGHGGQGAMTSTVDVVVDKVVQVDLEL